jgi:hypothetical protein
MGKNSGYLCQIDTGGKAVARHSEQEKQFKELKKYFIHYLTDDFHPVLVDGKEKTGLIDSSRLKVIGMYD